MNNDNYWEQFVSNVGLITTRDAGDNIMAAAWTYQISYEPGLIAVCINPNGKTGKIIEKKGEFVVHIASKEQNSIASIAGGHSGGEIDKISVLKELGCEFIEGKQVRALVMNDTAVALECKLKQVIPLGDHVMYVGEVVYVHDIGDNEEPLVYKGGKYFSLGNKVEKPEKKILDVIDKIVKKHKK